MTRPGRSGGAPTRRALAGTALGSLVLILTACVGLNAEAVVSPDGSGRLAVQYSLPRYLSVLDSMADPGGTLPFPVERETLDRRALATPGVTVTRWSREDLPDEIRVSAELRFTGIQPLVEFLDPGESRLSYAEEGGRRRLRVVLADGIPRTRDATTWADLQYDAYEVSLSLSIPNRTLSSSPGTVTSSGSTARYSAKTADLLKQSAPLAWVVSW